MFNIISNPFNKINVKMVSKKVDLQKIVFFCIKFIKKHKNQRKMFTIKYFKDEVEHDKIISRIIYRFERDLPVSRLSGSGSVQKKPDPKINDLTKKVRKQL